MKIFNLRSFKKLVVIFLVLIANSAEAKKHFNVIGFYTAKEDQGHI